MKVADFDIVFLGLTITSSWGNGHATTYRGLMRELTKNGFTVLFLERDMPWYAANRDLHMQSQTNIALYSSFEDLQKKYTKVIANAGLVIVGSYVPEGIRVGEWVQSISKGLTAFYDIDTPVTIANLLSGKCEYLNSELISRYDLYLSFAGGPILKHIENVYGAPIARPLYCSVDPDHYYPDIKAIKYDLGYMGTFCIDRQPSLDKFLLDPAKKLKNAKFIIAGPQYPDAQCWPKNVLHVMHIPPGNHRDFYCSQRFTLNLTRADMIQAGYAPSVRLFEAAACGVPIISDFWEGLDSFFKFGEEILLSTKSEHTLNYLQNMNEEDRIQIGNNGRKKVLAFHTAAHRAKELENYWHEACRIKYRCSKL